MSDTDWRTDSGEEDVDEQGRNLTQQRMDEEADTGRSRTNPARARGRRARNPRAAARLRGCGFGSGRDDSPGSALGPASAPGPLTGLLAEPGPDWVREDVGTRVLQLLLVFDQT